MDLAQKVEILASAARYDASCASSGAPRRDSLDSCGNGRDGALAGNAPAGTGPAALGSTTRMGICHSYAPDGRCISLLKLLLTNVCVYDCLYCVNRRSSDVRRARFTVDEVVRLTIDFYRRNFIEGLFLSSGIVRTADHTMEQLARVARELRLVHGFRGYIHLKAVPGASPEALALAGRHADRLSANIELPTEDGLARLAPEKSLAQIQGAMAGLKGRIEAARAEPRAGRFAPAGQSTQMIVGADGAPDRAILATSARLYAAYGLRRVYYSAFSPIPDASALLPPRPAPLLREHRLYQADWLMRFYGFEADELTGELRDGMLDLEIDPKLAWALGHRERFPVDVNRADRESLLRVPGLGARTAARILSTRRHRRLRLEDLRRLGASVTKIRPFVLTADPRGGAPGLDALDLRGRLTPAPAQLELFGAVPEGGSPGSAERVHA